MSKRSASNPWFVYIVRAGDGTLYTGIARDVEKRLEKHRSGKGSRYLRSRGPLKVVYREKVAGVSGALKREIFIKSLPKNEKLALIVESKAKRVSLRPSRPGPKGPRRAGS